MLKKIFGFISKNRTHFLIWILFAIYEYALAMLMNNLYPHPILDPLHFSINILFFYIHANFTLPFALKKGKRVAYFLIPIFALQMSIYILMHFTLDKIMIALEVIKLNRVYVLNMAVITRNLYRGIYFFGFSTGYYFLRNYLQERKRAQELEKEQLQAVIQQQQMQQDLLNAQNAFLKAQINPHFLFNTLDFVYHNVNRHSPIAGEAVARLAEMMRFAIATGEREQNIRLGDEIEQVENLIFLYQIRKNNELAIAFSYPPAALNVKTIPLVLLTLVENIFKHGYLSKDENHRASIKLELTADLLQITMLNTIGRSPADKSNQTGLTNIRERLAFAYGDDFAFSHQAKGDKFIVNLSVPLVASLQKAVAVSAFEGIDKG